MAPAQSAAAIITRNNVRGQVSTFVATVRLGDFHNANGTTGVVAGATGSARIRTLGAAISSGGRGFSSAGFNERGADSVSMRKNAAPLAGRARGSFARHAATVCSHDSGIGRLLTTPNSRR